MGESAKVKALLCVKRVEGESEELASREKMPWFLFCCNDLRRSFLSSGPS